MSDPQHGPGGRRRRALSGWARRLVVPVAALALLPMALAPTSQAATEVTVKNPGGLAQAGPVNPAHGFPAWYEDSTGRRLEACIDHQDPLCGIPVAEVPNPSAPVAFPSNWPAEFFYQLVEADVTLRGGGTATLVLGLEGAWLNEVVNPGDQTVFARVRVDVKGGAPGTTYRFKHPFGELTVDTDGTGRGRFVQDVSPALNNFDTPLAGNFGPFLRWRPGVLPNPPAGYVGDPNVLHQVAGSPTNFNRFTAWQGTLQEGTTDLFSISGKIATNTGLTVDTARVNGGFLDVFATSKGTQLELTGQDGRFATTAMLNDPGSERFYARIALQSGAALPTEITVRNLGDNPVSSKTYKISGVTVNQAGYDGTNLTVAATAIAPATYPLEVVGFKDATGAALKLTSADPVTIPVLAPPATVTVKDAAGTTASLPVTILGGAATPAGPPTGGGTPPDPAALPGAPTGVQVTAGDGQAGATWVAPASTGTSPLLRYLVTATDAAGVVYRATAAPDATQAAVDGLVNGQRYTVRVRAVNSSGAGPSSAPLTVTPVAP
ncbi:fibronectin type III domain-containing protein [Geodermatophilus ruber]|uniref:Fibronectin type III domain-containing protein n=1 Tax=Geodermatophilus ruber TaxID=504800 RepID=A0A1I4BPE9_9ACTN|nr:fibronectin type III domain-containing protein [Geodermatophilus ruber]SFK70555.1 Fibronectin type III domain-containing protein [Geodermatophilus ruber]